MDRRDFLRLTGVTFGALAGGGLLAACDRSPDGIPGGEPTLNLLNAQFPEVLVGDDQRFVFGLTDLDNATVEEPEAEAHLRTVEGERLGGPFPVELIPEGPVGRPVYRTALDVTSSGFLEVVVVAGSEHAVTTVTAVEPEEASVPPPGSEAIAVPTPTFDDARGFEAVCTRQPDCPLHEVSLDEALAAGRPTLLLFATPAFCQTAVCGPGVDEFVALAQARDWGEVAFIHCEIFTDAGVTVAEPVEAWGLPSEPWLFAIDGQGTIRGRLDGPLLEDELTALAERLT